MKGMDGGSTMAASEYPIIETRRDQMFPVLEPAEIDRVRRFGETRAYRAGGRLATTGEGGPGMVVILAGNVVVTQRDELAHPPPIVTYGPGSFLGELAQLSGRPALVDAHTQGTVEALVIPPDRLREVLVEEAELGERIIRALILRRVGLLETGSGGPVIIGRADHGDVLRLEGFLARNGHPHQRLDPETDPGAKALLDRFHIDLSSCRSCCVQADSYCAILVRRNWPAALVSSDPWIPPKSMTWPSWAPAPQGS